MVKSKSSSIDWLGDFGKSKNYDIFFVKSSEKPIRMALTMERLFHSSFRMLGSYPLIPQYENHTFPIFFSTLNQSQEAQLILIPNSITIPAQEVDVSNDPLLGGFLFDEEYFFFNNMGNTLFKSAFSNYDYMLLLLCNKNFQVAREVVEPLTSIPAFRMIQKTDLLEASSRKMTEKKRAEFLKNLFSILEVQIGNFMKEELTRRLHGKTSIPKLNYVYRIFGEGEILVQDLYAHPLMRREDI